ncbi:hypothetical protein [Pseudomonas sp.]|uniref:hypothetical protein n=1 Tax=Pseudomonas sp. TaxID=306 RepID=UPI003D6DABE0
MHDCTDTQAVCRGCGLKLRGSPSWRGGVAYHPETDGEVHRCHYGGWVCSRRCDIKACVELEGTMPGCGTVNSFQRLSPYAKESINRHWPEAT